MAETGDNTAMEIESTVTTIVEMVVAHQSQENVSIQEELVPVIDLEADNTKERKEMQPRSEMWKHFIKDDKGDLIAAKCKYCSREMKASTKGHGTSALNKHFNVCRRNPHLFAKDPKQGTLQATQGEVPSTWRFDQVALRDAFVEMVIEDELPFCFGERPSFRKFMSRACPRFQVPSRRSTTRDTVRVTSKRKLR